MVGEIFHHGHHGVDVFLLSDVAYADKELFIFVFDKCGLSARHLLDIRDAVVDDQRLFIEERNMGFYIFFYVVGNHGDGIATTDNPWHPDFMAQEVDAMFLMQIVQVVDGKQLYGFLAKETISGLLVGEVPQVGSMTVGLSLTFEILTGDIVDVAAKLATVFLGNNVNEVYIGQLHLCQTGTEVAYYFAKTRETVDLREIYHNDFLHTLSFSYNSKGNLR